ncbi:MAG TPA: hypothetical protein PKE19_00065, partial [Aestuariivirga sp.]|nr:hypothetical protein [Aestuariivirga sp.]
QWRMTFAQKIISGSRLMRGKVNIFPTDKTHLGFNVKISGDWYRSWPDVISGLIGTKNGITFAEAEASQETFASLLERHNQDLVAELGEWRPVVASERASNVIDISKFIDRIMSEAA